MNSASLSTTATLGEGLNCPLLDFDHIPLIDIAPLIDDSDPQTVADAIGTACRDIGFLYIKNHSVPIALVQAIFAQAEIFFAQAEADKLQCHIKNSPAHRGYFPLFEENTDPNFTADLKEGFDLARDLAADHPAVVAGIPLHGSNVWPADMPEFRAVTEAYYQAMQALAAKLMQAFALALDLRPEFFADKIDQALAQLRLLHYPPQAGHIEQHTLGCGAHTDYGCLTILAQDKVGGLQVQNAIGEWVSVPPLPDTFVINLGDQMARWSNGLFKATPHRVINTSGLERYSLPFFFDPNWDAVIECLASCQDAEHPPQYAPVQAGPYLLSRLQATFNYMEHPKQ